MSDPALTDGSPPSGVAANAVGVTLLDENGGAAGLGTQYAAVAGNTWSVDYIFTESEPSGPFTLSVEAEDVIASQSQLTDEQRAAHRTRFESSLVVDATPPGMMLDEGDLPNAEAEAAVASVAALSEATAPAGLLMNGDTILGGGLTEHPVALEVTWTTPDGGSGGPGGDQVGVTIGCNGLNLLAIAAGQLITATQTLRWQGQTHRGSACEVSITGAGASGVTGTVRVCRSEVGSWSAGQFGMAFTADAALCGTQAEVAGISQAEVGFVATFPGSPFFNESLPGQIAFLPLSDTEVANETLTFADRSGRDHHGVCTGGRCPATGQQGHLGSGPYFDGSDDAIEIPDSADFDLGDRDFTLAFWVKPDGANINKDLLHWSNDAGDDFSLRLISNTHLVVDLTLNGGATSHLIADAGQIGPDAWHHLALVRAGKVLRVYIDGAATAHTSMSQDLNQIDSGTSIWIGSNRRANVSPYWSPFRGWLNDVRVFDRSLEAYEVAGLVRGSGAVLALSFEDQPLAGFASLKDTSGAGHNGRLYTDNTGAKAAAGQVGSQSLALDGVEDYVTIAEDFGLDLGHGRYTQAAWVYPSPEDTGSNPVFSSAAYGTLASQYPFLEVVNRTQLTAGFGDGTGIRSVTTGPVLTEDAWNHVAATFDGTTYTIYVNGKSIYASDALAGKLPAPMRRFDIGRGATETLNAAAASGVSCAQIAELTFTPEQFNARGYEIWVNGDKVWTGVPVAGQTYRIMSEPFSVCGAADVAVWPIVPADADDGGRGGETPHLQAAGASAVSLAAAPGISSHDAYGKLDIVLAADSTATYFRGRLDEARIWPRPLSAIEVAALAADGFRPAELAERGAGVVETGWTAHVPAGLEGAYRLDLRGQDEGGLGTPRLGVWDGGVDTLAPRLALTRTVQSTGAIHYLTTAEDFNLQEAGFKSPCGAGVVSSRLAFDAPWYAGLFGDDNRLNSLTADCTLPYFVTQSEVGAYDTAGLASSAVVSGTLAYVADGAGGLQIIDISDPALPILIGSLSSISSARGIDLALYPLTTTSAVQAQGRGTAATPDEGRMQPTPPAPDTGDHPIITTPTPAPPGSSAGKGLKSLAEAEHPGPRPAQSRDAGMPGQGRGQSSIPAGPAERELGAVLPSEWPHSASPNEPPDLDLGSVLPSAWPVAGSMAPVSLDDVPRAASTAGRLGVTASSAAPSSMTPDAAWLLPAALDATGSYLVSSNIFGDYGEGRDGVVSGDGQVVAFASGDPYMVDGDENGTFDVFLRDTSSVNNTLVSFATTGGAGNAESYNPAISDGCRVVFTSLASNLVADDTNDAADVFLYDCADESIQRISVSSAGAQADGGSTSYGAAISADGNYVVFESDATNLVSGDTNAATDVFLRDVPAGVTVLVSADAGSGAADGPSAHPAISGAEGVLDGLHVAFESAATDLVAGDTNGQTDVFVFDYDPAAHTGAVARIGAAADGGSTAPALSDDGRWVAFQSDGSDLAGGDTNGIGDIFIHDRTSGVTWRVIGPNGEGNDASYQPSFSPDGRFVAFVSMASNLVVSGSGGDTNELPDVFAYDRETGAIERLSFRAETVQFETESTLALGGALSADGSAAAFNAPVFEYGNSQTWLRLRDIVAPGAELEIESMTVVPASPKLGQPFDVTVRVRNTGSAAGHFLADVYLDATPAACDSGAGAWDGTEIFSLGAGSTYEFTRHHSGFGTAGSHTLQAQVDSACELTETVEANIYTVAGGFTVQATAFDADLVIDSLVVEPAAPRPNEPVTYKVTITNGGADATGAFSTGVYLDAAPGVCDGNALYAATVAGLAAGASTTVEMSEPLGYLDGTAHDVYAQADNGCLVPETGENNTAGPVAFTVSGSPVQPDLRVDAISASPAAPGTTAPVTVTVTVSNQGAAYVAETNVLIFLMSESDTPPDPLACGQSGNAEGYVQNLAPGPQPPSSSRRTASRPRGQNDLRAGRRLVQLRRGQRDGQPGLAGPDRPRRAVRPRRREPAHPSRCAAGRSVLRCHHRGQEPGRGDGWPER